MTTVLASPVLLSPDMTISEPMVHSYLALIQNLAATKYGSMMQCLERGVPWAMVGSYLNRHARQICCGIGRLLSDDFVPTGSVFMEGYYPED